MLGLRVDLERHYAIALDDLFRAGVALVHEPTAPRWYHTQRVTVAAIRAKLASIDEAVRIVERRTPSDGFRRALRLQEATTLERLARFAGASAEVSRDPGRLRELATGWLSASYVLRGHAPS